MIWDKGGTKPITVDLDDRGLIFVVNRRPMLLKPELVWIILIGCGLVYLVGKLILLEGTLYHFQG
jgi:hypothetical protein